MHVPTDFDLGLWVAGLGPRLGAAQVSEFEGATWLLLFEGEQALAIEHDPDRALLVLTAVLGKPPPGGEAAAYRLLLEVSALWRQTAGLRMAIDPDEGDVIQLCDFSLSGMDIDRLESSVRRFIELAGVVRQQLQVLGTDDEIEAMRPSEFVRV